jgi:hypothetical protein
MLIGRSRGLVAAIALSLALAAAVFISSARSEAQTRCGNEFYYYSDDTYTEVVGYEVWDCDCSHGFGGERTSYREIVPLDC